MNVLVPSTKLKVVSVLLGNPLVSVISTVVLEIDGFTKITPVEALTTKQTPTTIKKFAGKGNMNKLQLFEAFQKNSVEDQILAQSPLYKVVKNLEIGKKIPKPLDDLIDAYFLVAYVANPST